MQHAGYNNPTRRRKDAKCLQAYLGRENTISLLNSMNSFAFPRGLNFVVSADIWFSKNGQKNK